MRWFTENNKCDFHKLFFANGQRAPILKVSRTGTSPPFPSHFTAPKQMTADSGIPPQKANGRRKGPWSQAEIERLKRSYGVRSDAQIGRELNRSVESVRRMASRVFAGEIKTGPWIASEVRDLKNYLGAAGVDVIAQILRRSPLEIKRKVDELQSMAVSGPWTPDDIQDLKRMFGTRENTDLVMVLGRPESDIVEKAHELCLSKDKGFRRRSGVKVRTRMPRWSADDIEFLRSSYPAKSNLDLAKELGRSVKSVVSKAHDLGLKKDADRLRNMGRENVNLRYNRESAL